MMSLLAGFVFFERDALLVSGVCFVWGVLLGCAVQLLQLEFAAMVFYYGACMLCCGGPVVTFVECMNLSQLQISFHCGYTEFRV